MNPVNPESLNCPMCGAAVSSEASQCLFCSARLATVACPDCFGMMFQGSRHCPRCGARAARREVLKEEAAERPNCPRCGDGLETVMVGETGLRECPRCDGLWVDMASFEQLCTDREQQSVVLGAASPVPAPSSEAERAQRVRYVPCPVCRHLMNRVNFARCSGVVVDVCKGHGTWFDRDELRQIVEFIRGGGLEAARAKERRQLADEREQLRLEQLAAERGEALRQSPFKMDKSERPSVVRAARGLLKLLRE